MKNEINPFPEFPDEFYLIQQPITGKLNLTWYESPLAFDVAWQLNAIAYDSKESLIADAGWAPGEVPEQVRELPDGPCFEWSFGDQPSEYRPGAPDLWDLRREAAAHDVKEGHLVSRGKLNALMQAWQTLRELYDSERYGLVFVPAGWHRKEGTP